MRSFYSNVTPELAQRIDALTRLVFELRENRNALLAGYGVIDEAQLLVKIRNGEVAEHPAYEHFLSATVLAASSAAARSELAELLAACQDAR